MKTIFFDVESTGLSKTADILSLAAIVCNEHLDIERVYNEYFLYGDEVPSGAVAVHGLTTQKLDFLGTRDFMTAAPQIYALFSEPDITLAGHNIVLYDVPVLQHNLGQWGYPLAVEGLRMLDTMVLAREKFKGSHKLGDCVRYLCKVIGQPVSIAQEIFQDNPSLTAAVIDKDNQYHSALYDSYSSYFIYLLMKKLWG